METIVTALYFGVLKPCFRGFWIAEAMLQRFGAVPKGQKNRHNIWHLTRKRVIFEKLKRFLPLPARCRQEFSLFSYFLYFLLFQFPLLFSCPNFRMLWAKQINPNSISTFTSPRRWNLHPKLCLIFPKLPSSTVPRCFRNRLPCLQSRLSRLLTITAQR